jgi:hypothetical protein
MYLEGKEITMIVVRLVFQTKWGKAQEAVDEFARAVDVMRRITGTNGHVRILTDLSGPFHTVVQEIEVESLAKWEQLRAAMFANPEFQGAQSAMGIPFEGGRTEFYTLEKAW